ncbi:RHS repeat domain-containing protein [Shewanella chilikensis]|uniref:RHS repeat domain-containing protein n=1 Tax=Shewanella chilikensis TaxID=558541 RepID=UPI003B968B19
MVEKTLKRDGFRAQTRFYHWDEEDRLIRVSLPNGDIWHYEYDVFGRRCRKYRQQPAPQPTSAQSLTQQISQGDIRYLWLGDQLSQQQSYYADGSVATTQWLYERGSFRPLAQIRQLDTPNDPGRPELHYAVTDLVGNVRELCDPQGQIHWRGEQGLWQDFHQWRLSGTPKKYLEQAANEPLHCDLRYQGQIYDRETGLYYNRHRYYDPEICQYLSPDPIGLAGGTRPQAYVHNPLEWVDPLGLASLFDIGTYGSLNGSLHVGDNLQAHEFIRHEFLRQEGLAGDSRLSDNPSIALDLDHHTRGPAKDTRGIGGVHYHESVVRAEKGLGRNQFASSFDEELEISSEAMRRAGIPEDRISVLKADSTAFYERIKKCGEK